MSLAIAPMHGAAIRAGWRSWCSGMVKKHCMIERGKFYAEIFVGKSSYPLLNIYIFLYNMMYAMLYGTHTHAQKCCAHTVGMPPRGLP
ncbi:hypothetical protein KL86DPRO_30054 [uncultured delta proteobacterium]|uniref:Uncharacterized protein n=1 Tax=uncultured delta proteobacterium TaxID=34034 RepID=A0A212K741_9DELT|nr:hypothetical protein KL86DPRO_30054 [uncultured delta proteobacterium]